MARHSTCTQSAILGVVPSERWLILLIFVMTQPSCFDSFIILTRQPQHAHHSCHDRYLHPYEICNHRMTAIDTGEGKGDDVRHRDVLLNLLSPPVTCDIDRMSSTDLAYIGDVVYEMLVRSNKVWPPKRTSDLQQQVVQLVRGEFCITSCTMCGLVSETTTHFSHFPPCFPVCAHYFGCCGIFVLFSSSLF